MKKVGDHNSISRKLFLSIALMLSLSFSLFAQDVAAPAGAGDPAAGKALFNTNCAACHKLDDKMTGPALRGVADKHSKEWLVKWVHGSAALIASGDAEAVNILAYTSQPKEEAKPAAGAAGVPGAASAEDGISNNVILGALALVMVILVV